jgi:hypothetical protein
MKTPAHRIRWDGSPAKDKDTLNQWSLGTISTQTAILAIESHNDIRRGTISTTDFIENAHWLGYAAPGFTSKYYMKD